MARAQTVTEMQEEADLKLREKEDGSVTVELPDSGEDATADASKSSDLEVDKKDKDKDDKKEEDDVDEDGDSKHASDDNEETDEEHEARLEARREKRRIEKQRRAERAKRAKESDRLEIEALRRQVNELSGQIAKTSDLETSFKLSQTDKKIDDLNTQIEYAKIKLTDAIQSGDAVRQSEILDIMADLKADLKTAKGMREEQVTLSKTKNVTADHDEGSNVGRLKQEQNRLARQWMERHAWFDPQARDFDSKVVKLIDKEIDEEGLFRPWQPEYWDELTLRCEERLEHHFLREGREGGRMAKKSPGVTSSRSEAGNPQVKAKKEFYLSPARRQAIEDAGRWNDPVMRRKMINSYMKYDEEQARNQR